MIFKMSRIQQIIIRYTKKQKRITQAQEKQCANQNEGPQTLDLLDKHLISFISKETLSKVL